jgi:hypothetical protein
MHKTTKNSKGRVLSRAEKLDKTSKQKTVRWISPQHGGKLSCSGIVIVVPLLGPSSYPPTLVDVQTTQTTKKIGGSFNTTEMGARSSLSYLPCLQLLVMSCATRDKLVALISNY